MFFRAIGSTPHKTTLAYLLPNYILGHCDSLKENSLDGLCNTQISIRQKKKKVFKKGPLNQLEDVIMSRGPNIEVDN